MALRSRRLAALAAGAVALLIVIAFWPVSTHVGTDYVVAERRRPLWRKVAEFVERDRLTRKLASTVVPRAATREQQALAALHWTNSHIRPHPPDVPVVDDHVWSIIQRGYGSNDQQADVFTTVLTYAGVRAYWVLIGEQRPIYPISLALIDGRWRVFDVERSIVFRNPTGALATPDEIASSPAIIRSSATGRVSDIDAYQRYFTGFRAAEPGGTLRAEMQMPRKRLAHEMRALFGPD